MKNENRVLNLNQRIRQNTVNLTAKNFSQPPISKSRVQSDHGNYSKKIVLNFAISRIFIYLLAFLTPILVLFNVPSPWDFSKQALLIFGGGGAFLSWIGLMFWRSKVSLKKDSMNLPLIVLLFVLVLNYVFSIYPEQTLWGFFGGEANSLITHLFLASIFLVAFNIFDNLSHFKIFSYVSLLAGLVVAMFSLFQFYQIYLLPWGQTERVDFNLIGSIYSLAVYLGALLILTLGLFIGSNNRRERFFLSFSFITFFYVLLFINFKLVWIFLLVGCCVFFAMLMMKEHREKKVDSAARFIILSFIFLSFFLSFREKAVFMVGMPSEINLSQKASFEIMTKAIKRDPIFGAGLASFPMIYQAFRPANLGNFWSVDFNSAAGYFPTTFSTTGLLGIFAYTFFVVWTGKRIIEVFLIKKDSKDGSCLQMLSISFGVTWLFITLVLIFYQASFPLLVLWWLSLAISLSSKSYIKERGAEIFSLNSQESKNSLVFSLVFVFLFLGTLSLVYLASQKYLASTSFAKTLAADISLSPQERIGVIEKAVNLDGKRDLYYRNLSLAYLDDLYNQVNSKDKLTVEDSAVISGSIKAAVLNANQAMTLNPYNSANAIVLGKVYQSVLISMDGAQKGAVDAYEKAIQVDPGNISIYQSLADVYLNLSEKARQERLNSKKTDPSDEELKNLALAKQYLERAYAMNQQVYAVNSMLSSVYNQEGNFELALEKARENTRVFPQSAAAFLNLGLLHYGNQDYEKAIAALNAAVSLDENYANALYFLALSLEKRGDKAGAIEVMERVVKLNPDNQQVSMILSNLKNGKDALSGLDGKEQEVIDTEQEDLKEELIESNQTDQSEVNPKTELPDNIDEEKE